jgi:poly(A) polymerase
VVFDTTILGSNPSAPAKIMKRISSNIGFLDIIKKKLFPFYKAKEIVAAFKILEKNKTNNANVAMFVGGCVRKYLNNQEIDDVDIATTFSPDEIIEKFKGSNFKVIKTGTDHGTVTVILNNIKLELTTLRKDIKTYGRHADVSFINNWEEDSNRRDFTINAIYMDRKGKIFDPQQGVNDLKNNVVKFIGLPSRRIEEDYLRIIRFIRFSIQYKSVLENETLEAIKINLIGIKNISKERILSELFKILALNNFIDIVEGHELKNIFLLIFPEFIHLERLKKNNKYSDIPSLKVDMILAILLIDKSNNYEYFCHKYKVSNNTKLKLETLRKLLENFQSDNNFFKKNLDKNIYYFGKENLKKLNTLIFFINDKTNYLEYLKNLKNIITTTLPKFPYDGQYLIKKGLNEGKVIGQTLKSIEKIWIDNNFQLTEEKVQQIIKNDKN